MSVPTDTTSKQRIYELLDDLPPDDLKAVEGFVRFLHKQVKRAGAMETGEKDNADPSRYPTVSLSLDALDGLIGIMPSVGGDALAETEALYDIDPRD